ncbi:hypothetical protein H4R34_003413 [Dimargaris verticillata]|uniref:WD40-repeat-containing domain protein n=1 Tax=Dimargaris verticillata TaxID=2761393 RepID=A0A9W8B6Y1_9FUNG|nr:hypothetical protein H4R34_003413 [Dimargaris verticillata]
MPPRHRARASQPRPRYLRNGSDDTLRANPLRARRQVSRPSRRQSPTTAPNSSLIPSPDSTSPTAAPTATASMPEIPGFYYCAERNRYFKIEGASTHSRNPSSKVALAQRQQTSNWSARTDQQMCKLTQVSWQQYLDYRALGQRGSNHATLYYSQNKQGGLPSRTFNSQHDMAIQALRVQPLLTETDIQPLAPWLASSWESLTRSQVVGLDINLEHHQIMVTTSLGATLMHNFKLQSKQARLPMWRLQDVDSSFLERQRVCTMSTGQHHYAAIYEANGTSPTTLAIGTRGVVGTELSRTLRQSCVWSLALSNDRLALGELKCVKRYRFDYPTYLRKDQTIPTASDPMALAYDIVNPHLLYTGGRDGDLCVFDTRDQSHTSRGVLPRISHPGTSVCHLRQLGEWQWIAGTTGTTIALWDIRMVVSKLVPDLPPDSTTTVQQAPAPVPCLPHSRLSLNQRPRGLVTAREHPLGDKGFPRATMGLKTALPLLEFQGHVNTHYRDLGFDTHPRHHTLAAAGVDGRVRFWSTLTGQLLKVDSALAPPQSLSGTAAQYGSGCRINQLQWLPANHYSSTHALLATQGLGLHLWDL